MQVQPVFLISVGRSGSNLLRNILVRGFRITDRSEVFNPDGDPNEHAYFPFLVEWLRAELSRAVPRQENFDRLFDEYIAGLCESAEMPFVLIDIKYSQTHFMNPLWHNPDSTPGILQMITKRGFRIVHLIRRNLLARRASFELASTSGRWVEHVHQDTADRPPKDALDTAQIRQDLTRDLARIKFFDQCLHGYPHLLNIFYEDILDDGALSSTLALRFRWRRG